MPNQLYSATCENVSLKIDYIQCRYWNHSWSLSLLTSNGLWSFFFWPTSCLLKKILICNDDKYYGDPPCKGFVNKYHGNILSVEFLPRRFTLALHQPRSLRIQWAFFWPGINDNQIHGILLETSHLLLSLTHAQSVRGVWDTQGLGKLIKTH